ncbi:acyltransferase family protein [Terrarubrum flagellatum]|uniref:acyltransferase family protein n=1 Tax=Terrirubrum flagellatum TaxID=2895980 RepID=UPI0031455374
MTPSRYIPAIDGLRAIAVLSVFFYHLRESLIPGGYFGVDIFFVISGFVVTSSVADAKFSSLLEFQSYFYARRIVRIVPALIVCLAATALLSVLFIPSSWLSSSLSETGIAAFFGFSNIVLALNSDEYFSPRATFNPFVHTWSLGVEEQFYLIFPFLIYFFGDRSGRGKNGAFLPVALLSLLSLIACGLLTLKRWEYAFYLPIARFWEMGAGVCLYLAIGRWKPRFETLPASRVNAIALASIVAMAGSFAIPATIFSPFPTALIPVAASCALIACVTARQETSVAQALSMRAPVAIGRISYSLYLWHWPVFVLFRWTAGLDSLFNCVIAAGLALALSVASFVFVETPTRRFNWRSHISAYRFIPAALAVIVLCAGGAAALFQLRSRITLSVTGDTAAWYPVERPARAGQACRASKSIVNEQGARVAVWTATGCAHEPSNRVLHVVGDSHADAYTPMVSRFAMDTGMTVRIYTSAGCAFIPLYRPVSDLDKDCHAAHDRLARALSDAAKPDDIVFLASLRLPRFHDQWGGVEELRQRRSDSDPDGARRNAIVQEAVALLRPLADRGVRIEFEAPKPIFKSPPFRCADWFNEHNPVCAAGFEIDRSQLLSLRQPVTDAMSALATKLSNVTIWDPFPLLCPTAVCNSFDRGRPVYFDADHLSGLGNDMVYEDFRKHTLALLSAGQTARISR